MTTKGLNSNCMPEEMNRLIDVLTSKIEGLISERESLREQLQEAREEAELTLLQLHQVQEELEHYFLRSRAGDELATAQAHELARTAGLLSRMLQLSSPAV